MDDLLTRLVLDYQADKVSGREVHRQIMVEAFAHLNRFQRKGEDEISEFLVGFSSRVEGLLNRFQYRGLPFRHFLLRSLRWQWNSFRTDRARDRRRDGLAGDLGFAPEGSLEVAEPSRSWSPAADSGLSEPSLRRLVLLAMKAAPEMKREQWENLSSQTGVDLLWLLACQQQLGSLTDRRRSRRSTLVEKRSDAFCRRVVAEDDARRETDPGRRGVHERRAGMYRCRLASLSRRQSVLSTSPTHREVSDLLGVPKGTVDSGLHHLKRELTRVYSGEHESPSRHEQRS